MSALSKFATLTIDEATDCLIDYRGKTPPKTESGVRLITAKVIKEGRILEEPKEYIATDFYDEWMRRGLPQKHDVLITTEAPLGEVAILRNGGRIALAQRVILLRAKPGIVDSSYLFYALQSNFTQAELAARATGTTVLGVKQSELRKVRIPYRPLPFQQKIASILSAYDNLIENNTRRIAILEEITQRIYEEWFVHFRFPRHEKCELVDSVKGKIPKGWTISTISEVCISAIDGDWIETKDQGGSDYRLLQISNIGVGAFIETGNYRYITQDTFERLRCQEIKPMDILVARMPKPTGRAWLVTPMPWRMITAVDVAILKANPEIVDATYLVSILNSADHLATVEKRATGTTRLRISRSALINLPILVPPIAIQNQYTLHAAPIYDLITLYRQKNQNLRQTRDLLLPKLISGEIDVSHLQVPKPATV